MKRNWIGVAAILLVACGQQGSNSSNSRNFDQVGTTLDGFVSSSASVPTGQVSGYSFALTDSSGTLYKTAGGNQDTGTALAIASATKLPSVVAILTLVDAGVLDLDTQVATYLALDSTFTWPSDKQAITMRMLLSHTSGLPQSTAPAVACLNSNTTTLRQCAQDIANATLDYPPDTAFSYTGADFQVAGYVAMLLAGTGSWQTLFANNVATPLGLTTFTYGATLNPRIAGGAVSNVDDYMRILRMILKDGVADNGTRVLSDAMIQQLKTSQTANVTFSLPSSFPSNANSTGYTFGLFITNAAQYTSAGSPGPEFTDPGLFGTTPWFDAGLGYAAIILINQDTETGIDMLDAVRPVVISALH